MIIGNIIIDDDWSTDDTTGELTKKVIVNNDLQYILVYLHNNNYCIWLPHTIFFEAYKAIYSKPPGTDCYKNKMTAANHVDEFLDKLSKLKAFL